MQLADAPLPCSLAPQWSHWTSVFYVLTSLQEDRHLGPTPVRGIMRTNGAPQEVIDMEP